MIVLTECKDGSVCCGWNNQDCCDAGEGIFIEARTELDFKDIDTVSISSKSPSTTRVTVSTVTRSPSGSSTSSTEPPQTGPVTITLTETQRQSFFSQPTESTGGGLESPAFSPSPSALNTNTPSLASTEPSTPITTKVAIAISAVALSLFLGGLITFFLHRRRKRQRTVKPFDAGAEDPDGGPSSVRNSAFSWATNLKFPSTPHLETATALKVKQVNIVPSHKRQESYHDDPKLKPLQLQKQAYSYQSYKPDPAAPNQMQNEAGVSPVQDPNQRPNTNLSVNGNAGGGGRRGRGGTPAYTPYYRQQNWRRPKSHVDVYEMM
ncbi:hypothetical protein ABW19_dt0202676 [Dactylella cylindrospora]|nr:hypothetical protein ABW19_dt0202676 [Dactylella cylindrospora]